MNRKAVLIVVVFLLLVGTLAIGSGCTLLDPCAGQRDDCYESCPTIVIAKQLCQEKCNYQYDRCKGKY